MIDWTNESEKEQRDSALEDRMAKADAAIDAKALGALAADMALHDPANRDAALGLPLVMTGPDSTRRLDAMSVTDAKHRAAIAYSKLLRTLNTQEQKDAACDYMACELEVMDLLEGGAA